MAITGYTSSTSVLPGGTLDVYLSSDTPGPVTLSVSRYDYDTPTPLQLQPTLQTQGVPGPAQRSWEMGFGWTLTTALTIPAGWPSGLYVLRGPDGQTVLSFVVRAAQPGATSSVLLQVCYNTVQAYNNAGGKSFYGYNSGGESQRANKVSFLRPSSLNDGYEPAFIRWLKSQNLTVEYCSSVDLHTGAAQLPAYNLLLVVGHSEYWSKEMRDTIDTFVSSGGNLAVFSGNTCYRQVRFEQGTQVMVFYKQPQNDPLTNVDNSRVTVAFSHPPVSRPPNQTIGLGMDHAGGSWGGSYADEAYNIHTPGHWAFAGVSGTALGRPGLGLVGYETDAAATVEYAGFPCATGEDGTPSTFTILASADLRERWFNQGKPGRGTLGLFVRNGSVFNVGTTGWAAAALNDANVSRVTSNVISRLRTRNAWGAWERIGHANDVAGMTSLDGKLYAATHANTLWARYPAGADIAWLKLGHANDVRALAATEGRLYAATSAGGLWWRLPTEADVAWTLVEQTNPLAIQSLAATGGMLYALDAQNALWGCPASPTRVTWRRVPLFTDTTPIRCMTGHRDMLYAATHDNRLVRTNMDLVFEATAWTPLHHSYHCTALAVVEDMLFGATTENALWWMDLLHFKAL